MTDPLNSHHLSAKDPDVDTYFRSHGSLRPLSRSPYMDLRYAAVPDFNLNFAPRNPTSAWAGQSQAIQYRGPSERRVMTIVRCAPGSSMYVNSAYHKYVTPRPVSPLYLSPLSTSPFRRPLTHMFQ